MKDESVRCLTFMQHTEFKSHHKPAIAIGLFMLNYHSLSPSLTKCFAAQPLQCVQAHLATEFVQLMYQLHGC